MTLLLEIAYRGSAYHGWQVQSGTSLPTVQGELQKALEKMLGKEVKEKYIYLFDTGESLIV